MTAALASYSPSGSTAKCNSTIAFRLTDTVNLDANTISMVLTDEHATTYAVLTSGAFLTASGWAGSITINNSGATKTADVVIDRHPDLVAGSWTAAVTVSSVSAGSWAWEDIDILSGVMRIARDLMDGATGTGRTIPSGTFRHVDSHQEALTALAGAGPVQPYTITHVGPGDQDPQGYTICGDHTLDNEVIRISIAHSTRTEALLEFEQDRARDNRLIRACLQWPNNWTYAVGWCGAELTGPIYENGPQNEGDQVAVVFSHYDLDVTIREHHP